MARKKQTEDQEQIAETTPCENDSVAAGDIADAWLDEFSEDLTWGNLTRWLRDA